MAETCLSNCVHIITITKLLDTEKGDEVLDPGKMAIKANVYQYQQKLQHFYSTTLSGEYRDRLEKEFDRMNAYHIERTGQTLFDENPVTVSKQKVISQ